MPSKIVNEPSNREEGLVNVADIIKMKNDYSQKLQMTNIDPARNPVHKHYYFDISEEQITAILEQREGQGQDTKIRIHLVLNLPGQLNCHNTASIEDYLSIIVSGVDENNSSMLSAETEDQILIEGFKDFRADFRGDCCVVGDPPPTGGN
jgi:hypothetical protein